MNFTFALSLLAAFSAVHSYPMEEQETPTDSTNLRGISGSENRKLSILFPDNDCDADITLESTGSSACPNTNIVKLVTTKGDQNLPQGADVFYDIVTGEESQSGVTTVSFKVHNPFSATADVYVKHDKQALETFLAPTCDARLGTESCSSNSEEITVACQSYHDGQPPVAIVQVYFVSTGVDVDGNQATLDNCCRHDDYPSDYGVVEYIFTVQCACPPTDGTPSPTKSPTISPTVKITEATGTPTRTPTGTPTGTPTIATDPPVAAPTDGDCESLENLTDGFSSATGDDQWSDKCYPPITQLNVNNLPGRDDSVAVFVGGNYDGIGGAEVEGIMVVLGNLHVGGSGPGNFVSVAAGSHVLPNSGGDCIIVGGDLSASRNIQVFNQAASMECDIVYKGNGINTERWKTQGEVRQDASYDMTRYDDTKEVLSTKSQYWKTLPSTGVVNYQYGGTTYRCSKNDEIQVFNIYPNEYSALNSTSSYTFSNDCEGKTVLINVQGSGDVKAQAAAMFFKNKSGFEAGGFSTCMTESILWNFPDAATVDIGGGRSSEWHGSLLVGGDLTLTTTGHSGRTMVLGNLVQNRGGSEFHSYQFNPPTPLPNPDGIC